MIKKVKWAKAQFCSKRTKRVRAPVDQTVALTKRTTITKEKKTFCGTFSFHYHKQLKIKTEA